LPAQTFKIQTKTFKNRKDMSILAFQMPSKVVMEKADDFHGLFEFKPLERVKK